MHIRGDSTKETVDTNTKLQVYVKHGDSLYNWTMFEGSKDDHQINFVCNIHSQISRHDESNIFFLENFYDKEGELIRQQINTIKIGFSFSVSTIVFKQLDKSERIKSINVDQIRQYLLIMTQVWSEHEQAYKKRNFKIVKYDLKNEDES